MLFCFQTIRSEPIMIKVFYDDRCPLCRREIEYYKKQTPDNIIDWLGISQNTNTLEKYGISYIDSLKILHAINANKKMVYGVDAFILIWQQLRGWRWLAKFVQLPIVYQMTNGIYKIFANWRFNKLDHCRIDKKT